MLKRTLSGAVYVSVIVAFILLRQYVDYRIFNILTFLFASIGTYEIARALNSHLLKGWRLVISVYGALFMVNYAVIEYYFYAGYGAYFSLALSLLMILVTLVYSLVTKVGFKKFAVNCLGFIYPALFLLCLAVCNDFDFNKGFIAIVLVFVISPLTDTFAYLVGMTYSKIKKGNVKKLCPILSPKKTVAGAIGGLLGGILGSVLVCLIFNKYVTVSNAYLIFALIGLVSSVLNQLGDLFESYIKRKVNLKDIGNLIPGHGGIMDRIDGTLFVLLPILLLTILS